jgi:hypothetical protein
MTHHINKIVNEQKSNILNIFKYFIVQLSFKFVIEKNIINYMAIQ